MDSVTHDGRTTAYRRRGDADPALLFVHGSGGTSGVWKAQLARLATDYTVAALDLSSHGDSDDIDTEAGPETLDAYAADTIAVADAVDADVLVGNSLGGAVVLTALLNHDAADTLGLDGVVLAGSGAKLAVHESIKDWLANDWDRAVEFLHGPDRLFHDPDDRYVALSQKAMRNVGQVTTRRDFLSCDTFDVRDRLDELPVPLLALTGEHDSLTPPDYHEYLADGVPAGDCTTIPGAAHLAMLETPEAFNEEIEAWVSDL